MVNSELVKTVVGKLSPSGKVFVQTDIEFLAEEMRELFGADKHLKKLRTKTNPFPVKTERELAVESKNLEVYRNLFEKK